MYISPILPGMVVHVAIRVGASGHCHNEYCLEGKLCGL